MNWTRRLAVAVLVVVACTEDNPFAGDDTGSDATTSGSASAATNTGATASVDSSESAPDPSSDGSTEGATDSGAETTCPIGTHVCLPAVPTGFSGPVAVIEGPVTARDAGCVDAYATDATVAYDGLEAPEAICACECGEPAGEGCDIELVVDNSAGCGSPTDDWIIPTNTCVGTVAGAPGSYWQATATPVEGTCTATPSMDIAEARFTTRLRVCSASETAPGLCEGSGVCSPIPVAPFGENLCVYSEIETQCPRDGGYDVRRLVYRDLLDTRGCSACTCGIEGECTGGVYLFGSEGCMDDLVGSVSIDGACVQQNLGATAGRLTSSFEVDATCEPTGGEPEGETFGTGPITLCCRG